MGVFFGSARNLVVFRRCNYVLSKWCKRRGVFVLRIEKSGRKLVFWEDAEGCAPPFLGGKDDGKEREKGGE